MEKVSIQEASRRLNVPQAIIRQYIRDGQLKAYREAGASGRSWVVELPEASWMDNEKESYMQMARNMSPWWWPNGERTGHVHYVGDLGIEEIIPQFLCGLQSENIWAAKDFLDSQRCPECLEVALAKGLPLSSSQ